MCVWVFLLKSIILKNSAEFKSPYSAQPGAREGGTSEGLPNVDLSEISREGLGTKGTRERILEN